MTNAEHTEANLLPCNAAARLQARAESEYAVTPLDEFDQKLEQIIREFTLRIVVPRWTEFDTVWEAAIRVCDRYELGKSRQATPVERLGCFRLPVARPGCVLRWVIRS